MSLLPSIPNSKSISNASPLLLSLTLLGCGAGDAHVGWTVSEDTLESGVARVVNVPSADEVEPTWVIEEELRIGALDGGGPAQFGQLKGLAVTTDGRIAVLDAQAREVRIFAPDGAHLATFGRQGGGPGELEAPWGLMHAADDRLWVPDHRNHRMTIYDPDNGFDTSHPLPVLRYGFIWDGVMLDDGRVLKPSITLVPERRDILRVYGPGMMLVDSILLPEAPPVDRRNPPGSFYWEAPGGMPRGYMSVPFYPRGQRVFDPGGHVWTSAAGDPAYRITRATIRGDTVLVIETARPPVPVSAAARDSAIDAIRSALRERGAPVDQDWSRVPHVKPAVESLFVAEDGRLWVRTSSADSLITYDIYERSGRYAGTAVTSIRIWRWVSPVVREDELWAIATDEFDVPYVIRARIRGAASRAAGVRTQ